MRLLVLFCVVALGVLLVACGDEPAGQTEPVAEQSGQEAVAEGVAVQSDAVQAEEPQEEAGEVAEAQAVTALSQEAEAEESEAQAAEAVQAEPEDGESGEAESAEEEAVQGLSDVAATVVRDADVRIRPGLAWRVTDRLESGAAVVALFQAGGWVRIRYGDGLEGWIRVTALDLGEVEEDQILEQAAPPLIAEWRGEEYGVMGQSADGAEVRLLQMVDERPTVIGAPIDEVRLIDADVRLAELPILIADETVVFPGDDFRVGQGKILPKANEWMWLPWGWLLAHNDTHIWQWRPETDELEMIERPPGYAKLSPDGRYLAIARLCAWEWQPICASLQRVTIMPLDGSPPTSLFEHLRRRGASTRLTWSYWGPEGSMEWSLDSSAVMLNLGIEDENAPDDEPRSSVSLVFHVDGRMARFEEWDDFQIEDLTCQVFSYLSHWPVHWRLNEDNLVTAEFTCADGDGNTRLLKASYTLLGELHNTAEFDPQDWDRVDDGADLIRSAQGGKALSDSLVTDWSPSEEYALVLDTADATFWLYDAGLHALTSVQLAGDESLRTRLRDAIARDTPSEAFRVRSTWREEQVGAAVLFAWDVRAVLLGAPASGTSLVLDVGRPTGYPNRSGSQSWNSTGTRYHIVVTPLRPQDGLAVGALRTHLLLSFDQAGALVGALNIANTCEGSVPAEVLRHKADWSPDGRWFSVGGQQREGLLACLE